MQAATIDARAFTTWPLQTVPYRMGKPVSPTGHNADCSGFVSAVLDLAIPGLSTVTLVTDDIIRPLTAGELLQPGDFVGICGPGTEQENGHIMIVTWVHEAGGFDIIEQAGGTIGPTTDFWARIPDRFLPYRLIDQGDTMSTPEQDRQALVDAFRIEAMTMMLDKVRGGPTAGEDAWMVQAIAEIQGTVRLIWQQLANTAPGTVDYARIAREVLDEQARRIRE